MIPHFDVPDAPGLFKRGSAILLLGDEGSGKTSLAKRLAILRGTKTATIDVRWLTSAFKLGSLLQHELTTLIVEGFPTGRNEADEAMNLIKGPTVMVERRMEEAISVPSPQLIFCVHPNEFKPEVFHDISFRRRFNVITCLTHGQYRIESLV